MANEKSEILNFVAERAKQYWDENQAPYMLSDLSPDLKRNGMDYKKELNPEQNLSHFLRANSTNLFKIITHSVHKAKIGIIPPDADYSFEQQPASPKSRAAHIDDVAIQKRGPNRKYVILNFLQALSELDATDLDRVNIPVSVLAKLLTKK